MSRPFARGLDLLQQGQEIEYLALTGAQFDARGQTRVANTSWWGIGPVGFADTFSQSACR